MALDDTTRQFLATLHQGGAYSYWWTLEGRQSFWWEVGTPMPLPGGKRNVYVGVHPTTLIPSTNPRGESKPARELRAQLGLIAAINCLYTEYDAKDFGGDKDKARAAADAIQPPPSALIDSGGGYHLYWLLDEPYLLTTDEERQHAKRVQAAWVAYAGGDPAVKDLARVLRVPGTYNHKYDPPRLVDYVSIDLGRRYTLDTLEGICGHLMPDQHLPYPTNGTQPYEAGDRDRQYARAALDREVAAVLRAPPGSKKHDLIRDAAIRLGTLAGRNLLSDDEVIDELTRAANMHRADVKDTYRTALDGLAYGKQRPRDPSKLPSGRVASNGYAANGHGPIPDVANDATVPPLPVAAAAIYEHHAPCGCWLDDYTAYAVQAAPMTPIAFHTTAGLIAASIAIAGRLCLPLPALPLYPNLYALFLAPSTIAHKSTGFRILEQLLQQAGINHLLMPHKAPPEAFVADLDPYKLPGKKTHDMDFFLRRRAFAAQRGYLRDEVSALFAGLRREFNAGLLELILGLYDCQPRYEESTISRGDIIIERGYLTFFGASTPVEMGPHLANPSHWTNGLWARFALIFTETSSPFVFFPRQVDGLGDLARRLRNLYHLFPIPDADFAEYEDPETGAKERRIIILGEALPATAHLADGVWAAWETYSMAMHAALSSGTLEPELNASYGRFGTQAMKVALLLAALDTEALPVVVELRHFARAQTIVEGWRASLHDIWTTQGTTQETRLMARIQTRLEKAGASGMTARMLCRVLRASIKEINDALSTLMKAGQVQMRETYAANGQRVELWQSW